MNKNLAITSFLGAITIILGAFGAHSLKDTLDTVAINSFETAVRYQMYHVIVLLIVNAFAKFSAKDKNTITYLFFGGISCFSGSIYAISFGIDASNIWFVTPFGGFLFIIGWLKMTRSFLHAKK